MKHRKVWKSCINCLKKEKKKGEEIIRKFRMIQPTHKFTCLKASRVQIVLPKPQSIAACGVFNIAVRYIRCNSIGNKYQSESSIVRFISSNALVNLWPSSPSKDQKMKWKKNQMKCMQTVCRFEKKFVKNNKNYLIKTKVNS